MHVSNHVMNGNAVMFGILGAFIPKIKAVGVASADEINADTIKRVTCRFFLSVAFKNTMKGTIWSLRI